MIGILFRGKPERHPDTGWEPFSNLAISGDCDLAECDDILSRARNMGFTTKEDEGTMYIWKSKNCYCRFLPTNGGIKVAQQFLDGVR